MEANPTFNNKDDLVDGYLLHPDTSESSNAKRETESLFCVLTKRNPRRGSMLTDNCCCSGSDSDLSDCSDFDVISHHGLQNMDLTGELTASKFLSCSYQHEETLVNNLSLTEVNEENGNLLLSVSASPKEFHSVSHLQICSALKMPCIPELNEDIFRCSVNKEESQIPCNAKFIKNRSSATQVWDENLVDMQGSMEKMSSDDELSLSNKDKEPVPICIVPPDSQFCSLHRVASCKTESNVCDDHAALEITPLPLTKTLQGPPWLVCGSLATSRNLPLMEDNSGGCSSMEDRDAQLTQTPSTLYQEKDDGEDEICFADIDAMIRKFNLVPEDFDSSLNREEWNMSKHPRRTLLGLKHCTRTSMRRAVMFHGAIAVLHCPDSQHFIRKHEVIIGRSSTGTRVDIDLGKDGYGSKISRRQALVKLEKNGSLSLKNLGKRHILVDGGKLDKGQLATLTLCSSIEIRGIVLVLKINKEAVRQFLESNTQRNSQDDMKFKWCE